MINQLQEDLKDAMRQKDKTKLNVLRALKSSITNASLQKGNIDEPISNSEIIGIIKKEISKRQDSVEAFVNAKRHDLILKETEEIEILNKYLPIQWSEEMLRNEIIAVIRDNGASSKKDMGKVIKIVQELADGRADNRMVSKIVGELL